MKTEIELAKQAGWEYADDDRGFEPLWRFAELVRADERARMAEQPAQPEQEPLAERFEAMHGKGDIWITTIAAAAIARSTSPQTQPAQRKPLTDMQVDGEWILVRDLDTNDVEKSRLFARAIEAAHGIKENT